MTDPSFTERYFAASNSGLGFRNYYGEMFTEQRTDRLYILKGGPGTGKSRFLHTVARRARAHGYTVTEYACSSDPASLDGILLRGEGKPTVGLLDGTAPHAREPVLPGAHDDIVNLGAFWDGRRLMEQAATIRSLAEKKSAAYTRAYGYLAAALRTDEVADGLMDGVCDGARLRALATRILRQEQAGDETPPAVALRRAVSMTGDVTLHTYEGLAETLGGRILAVEDFYGMGFRLTKALWEISRQRKLPFMVSYDPLNPRKIDGLLYPESGLCVLVGHVEAGEAAHLREVKLRRYADSAALRGVRGELRRALTLKARLTEAAAHSLAEAATHHFELEGIYASAMDFRAKEAFTESFCAELLRT